MCVFWSVFGGKKKNLVRKERKQMNTYTNVLQILFLWNFSMNNITSNSNTDLTTACHVFQNKMGVNYWIVYPMILCAEFFLYFGILRFPEISSQRDWHFISEANFLQHFCILRSLWQEIISLRDTAKLKLKSSPISHFLDGEWLFLIHCFLNCIAQTSFQTTSEPLKKPLVTGLNSA